MNEIEHNVDHKKALRWFFKHDPRSHGVKLPRGLRVVTLRIIGFPYLQCSRDATLLSITLKAQFLDAAKRGVPKMEINEFELQLPRRRLDVVRRRTEYDLSNTTLARDGSDLYALFYHRRQPLMLGYVEWRGELAG
jgi:hypothetical protein